MLPGEIAGNTKERFNYIKLFNPDRGKSQILIYRGLPEMVVFFKII